MNDFFLFFAPLHPLLIRYRYLSIFVTFEGYSSGCQRDNP